MEKILTCLGWRGSDRKRESSSPALLSISSFEKFRDSVDARKSTFTVLVTGMGAYPRNPGHDEDGHYSEDENTSHLITTLLPADLKPFSEYNPTPMTIRILNPTADDGCAIKSEYGFVREYCKGLWKNIGNKVDLVIHLGMADGWEWYTIERSGWKQGTVKRIDLGNGRETEPLEYYVVPDDIGETYKDIPGPTPWPKQVPDQLWALPRCDVDEIAIDVQRSLNLNHGQTALQQIEVRPHDDAGNYLCGFISYESLAQALVHGYSAKAVFCHVPSWRDEKSLGVGRDFVCSLIGQIASHQRE